MTTRIEVLQHSGSRFCISHESGDLVHQQVRPALDRGESVELSFAGVEDLTSMFLNAAVGRLYGEFDYDFVDERVVPVEIGERHQRTWSLAMKRAKQYFENPERFERARRAAFEAW